MRDVLQGNWVMDRFTCSSDHFRSISFPQMCVTVVCAAQARGTALLFQILLCSPVSGLLTLSTVPHTWQEVHFI